MQLIIGFIAGIIAGCIIYSLLRACSKQVPIYHDSMPEVEE